MHMVAFQLTYDAMSIIEAILARRSSRTFNGLHLDSATISHIGNLCRRAGESPVEGEPGCFSNIDRPDIMLLPDFKADGLLGTYGVIKGACSFMIMAVTPDRAQQLLAGYLFERILLHCTAEGIGTCWLGGTFGKSGFQAEYDRLADTTGSCKQVAIVSPLGHRTPKTRFAERMMRRLIAADTRKPFEQIFEGIAAPPAETITQVAIGEKKISALTAEQKLAIALECVRRAPSSSNSQPWRAMVNRNLKGRITGVSFTCVSTGKFSPYDMGAAYCHFTESCRYLGVPMSLQLGHNPCELEATLDMAQR